MNHSADMAICAGNFSIARQYSLWGTAQCNQQFGNIQQHTKIVNPKTGAEMDLNILLNSVKNDVVSGERGKQWLLSCYAPFKEKPLFPGFVDMAFEELRFEFIEAQKSNCLEQYNQKLQQILTEAKARYKALENPTQEIVTLLTNIYNNNLNSGNSMISMNQQEKGGLTGLFGLSNSSVFSQSPQNPLGNSSSIFGQRSTLQNNLVQQKSVFGQPAASMNTGNIFGQPSASANTGSVFGQSQNASNIFQQAGLSQTNGSLFGQQPSMNRSSIFGQKTGSVFGQQQTGPNVFGQQNSGSIFGQQNNGSVFGQKTSQSTPNVFGQPAPQSGNNVLGRPNNQSGTNIFGQPSSSGGIFGQNNPNSMITQQTTAQTVGSTFGQQSNVQNGGSIFGQQNSTQNNTGSIFGAQKNTTSIFGQQNSAANAGNMMDVQPTPSQNVNSIFGQNANQNSNNIFQSKPQSENIQQTNNIFGVQNENKVNTQIGVFGNVQQGTSFQQVPNQNTQPGSIFGRVAEPSNQSVFGPKTTQSNSIFGLNSANATQDAFGGSKPSNDKIKWGAYSKIEDLSEEEIKWFNSDTFDIDNIPEKPPTYEMCF